MASNRSYSEFFSSGLRGTGAQHNWAASRSRSESPTPPNALKAVARYNVLRTLARRASLRKSAPSSPKPAYAPPFMPIEYIAKPASPAQKHRRRSSIIDLPARLLGRVLPGPPDTWSVSDAGPNSDTSSGDWIHLSHSPIRNHEKVDPFGASPYSSSFFTVEVEAPEDVATAVAAPPRERRRSLAIFDLGERVARQSRRARRPHSIQSLPALSRPPLRPRQASFQLQLQTQSRDKYDRTWPRLDEDEEAASPVWSADDEDGDVHDLDPDPVGAIDWRQFHTELLRDEL